MILINESKDTSKSSTNHHLSVTSCCPRCSLNPREIIHYPGFSALIAAGSPSLAPKLGSKWMCLKLDGIHPIGFICYLEHGVLNQILGCPIFQTNHIYYCSCLVFKDSVCATHCPRICWTRTLLELVELPDSRVEFTSKRFFQTH